MSLPAQDDFNRASLDANWTSVDGTPQITANEASGGNINSNFAYWNADSFNDSQYGDIFNAEGSAANGGPATRIAATRCYALLGSLSDVKLYRIDGDESFSLLQTVSVSGVADGERLRLESEGSTHRCYLNTVQAGTDQGDATYASGSVGFFIYGLAPRLDNWEGGNMGGAVRRFLLVRN